MPPVPDRAALAPATPATRLLCLIVCLVVALLAPSPVAAQSATPTPDPALKAAAEQIFAQARTLYEAGDVAGARAALLSALEF